MVSSCAFKGSLLHPALSVQIPHGGADAEFLFSGTVILGENGFLLPAVLRCNNQEGIGKPAKVIFPNQTVIYLPFIEAGIPRTVIGHRRAGDVSLSRQIPV